MNWHWRKRYFKVIIILSGLFLVSCTVIQQIVNIHRPKVKIEHVRFSGMSLKKLNLVFDVSIENSNSFSINLAGFDYDFQLGGNSFIKGQQIENLVIASNGKSMIEIPVSINFKDVYQTHQSLQEQDSTTYKLICGLLFDLPILGKTRITVTKSGTVPLIKIPKLKITSLKLKKLSFAGADLMLILRVDNPNNFSLALNRLNYDFIVNNKTWAKGLTQQKMHINQNGKSTLSIPVSLNFSRMGRTFYNLITGNRSVDYTFKGDIEMNTSIPALKKINMPFNQSGQIKILK